MTDIAERIGTHLFKRYRGLDRWDLEVLARTMLGEIESDDDLTLTDEQSAQIIVDALAGYDAEVAHATQHHHHAAQRQIGC